MIYISFEDLLVLSVFFTQVIMQYVITGTVITWFSKDKLIKMLYQSASPFIFIVIGFPFKYFGILKLYALIQISFFGILVFSRFVDFIIKRQKLYKPITIEIYYWVVFIFLVAFFSYESRNFISYGSRDLVKSHFWVTEIITNRFSGYQPGLGIYLAPTYFTVEVKTSLDYLGFALGASILMLIFLLLEQFKKYSGYWFIVLFTTIFFVENQRYLIGFSNNQFYALYLILFIVTFVKSLDNKSLPALFLLTSLVLLSLTITTPSLTVYIGYYLLGLLLTIRLMLQIQIKLAIGFAFAYLLGIILYVINLRVSLFDFVAYISHFANDYQNKNRDDNPLTEVIKPIFVDLTTIEVIDRSTYAYYFFGYLGLILNCVILIFSIIKKNTLYYCITFGGLIFGISTLFGVGQLNFIQGRVGWLYIFNFLYLLAFILSTFLNYHNKIFTFLIGYTVLLFNLFHPVAELRTENEEIYTTIYQYHKNLNERIILYSSLENLRYFEQKDGDFILKNLNELNYTSIPDNEHIVIIFPKLAEQSAFPYDNKLELEIFYNAKFFKYYENSEYEMFVKGFNFSK